MITHKYDSITCRNYTGSLYSFNQFGIESKKLLGFFSIKNEDKFRESKTYILLALQLTQEASYTVREKIEWKSDVQFRFTWTEERCLAPNSHHKKSLEWSKEYLKALHRCLFRNPKETWYVYWISAWNWLKNMKLHYPLGWCSQRMTCWASARPWFISTPADTLSITR